MRGRDAVIRLSGAGYLALLLTAPILFAVADLLLDDTAVVGPLTAPLVLLLVIAVVAIGLWLMFRPTSHWEGWTRGWFMLGVIVWLYATVVWSLQGEAVWRGSFFLPLAFFLILLKRPSPADVWRAADAFGWVVACAGLFVLALEVGHYLPTWYSVHGQVGTNLLAYDLSHYWLPLRELLGLEGRWGGYAAFPNIQGQTGALLMVYGFTRTSVNRVAFVTAGGLILLLTDSRTSYAAGAVGLVLLALLPGMRTHGRAWPIARVLALLLGIAMAIRVLIKFVADPNLTGRIAVWPDFLSLTSQNPILGAGAPAIDAAVDSGTLPGWADQGHNIVIDTLVRYGALGLVLAMAFLGLALLICGRGVRLGQGVALALCVALLVSCMADLGLVWLYATDGMSFLILSVLLARRRDQQEAETSVQSNAL